jgi:dynactin complex subunit
MKLDQKSKEDLIEEIKELRKMVRKWQKVSNWHSMARAYGDNCASVNLGRQPQSPKRI